jgi:MSHA biogenesis protein MshO
MRSRGFTLIELILVITITGILAASITIFLKPTIDSYFDTRRRADLTDIADTALRRIATDIRSAVPNSIRWVSASCIQLVPTIAGGRYRLAADTLNDVVLPCTPSMTAPSTCSAPLDIAAGATIFDVLSPMETVPATDDWIVIGNQNPADVYTGANRSQIAEAPIVPSRSTDGQRRIRVASPQFPAGYDGGRFVAVPNAEKTLIYSCTGGNIYRKITSDFSQADTAACAAAGTDGAIVATDVPSGGCTFSYDPNQGATQQSGFVWLRLELSRAGESIALTQGVHVDNVP